MWIRGGSRMILELTIINDKGEPYILDEAICTLVIEVEDEVLTFRPKVVGNKVINYIKTKKDQG